MKKYFIILICFLFLTSCKTQQEIEEEKKQEEINKITEEVNKEEISDEAKAWLIDSKTKKMATILCVKTSQKCLNLKAAVDNLLNETEITIHFIYLDESEDSTKNTIKNTYDLKDYASYTPYIFITEKETLLKTATDINSETLISLLNETKIISTKEE